MKQSSDHAGTRHITTEALVWEGVTLSIAYEPSWLATSEDYGPAHVEIRVSSRSARRCRSPRPAIARTFWHAG